MSATGTLPAAVLHPVRDTNAFEATVEQLAGAVRLGVLPDGTRLPPERELAETMGVSRATLREAIAALRVAGLVRTSRGRGGGTVVTYVGASQEPGRAGDVVRTRGPQLRDSLDFRRVVEPGASYLAATRDLDDAQRAWLRSAVEEVAVATDPQAHRMADSRFHVGLASLSGSPMLIEAVTTAQRALHDLLSAIPVLPLNIAHSNTQHERVVAAVLGGRPERAREEMERHCDATAALLRGLLG